MRRWLRPAAAVGSAALLASGCGLLLGLHAEFLVVAGIFLVVGAWLVVATLRAVRHARMALTLARLSGVGELAGMPVRALPGVGPMVAGLVRPHVYCDREVSAMLGPAEQRAVLLHEVCHQRRRDPLRLVAYETLEYLFSWIPVVRRHVDEARARLEIRADQYALDNGASRAHLAGALLALSELGPAPAVGFSTHADRRVAALLGDLPPEKPPAKRWRWAAVPLVTVLLLGSCVPLGPAVHDEWVVAARCLAAACGGE